MAAPKQPPNPPRRAKGASKNDVMPTSVIQNTAQPGAATGYDFSGSQNVPVTGGGKSGWSTQPAAKPIPDVPQVPLDKPDLTIMGASGTSFFGGLIQNDEYNPELGWRDWVLKVEQMMRSDAQIEALFRLTVNTLLAAKWSIEPAADDDPAAAEIASFVESALFHDVQYQTAAGITLKQSWSQILRHILLMMPYGFSPMEVCWRTEDDGEGGYWVKFAKFQPLLPRTVYRWWVGEDNELEAIQTWSWKNYAYRFTNIPVSKLLLFTHNQQGQNYEGLSILRPVFPYWWYKQNFLKINAIAVERNGVEIPLIHLGKNATSDDAKAALKQGENARVNAAPAIVQPEDWKFEYPKMSQNHAEAILPSVQYFDVMMARAWFEQFINLGSSEVGAYNLDASQTRTWLMGLQAEANDICDTWQPVIEQIVRWNYGEQAVYPKLSCGKLIAQNVSALSDAITAFAAYLPPSPEMNDFMADLIGVPKGPTNTVEATNPSGPDSAGSAGGGGMDNQGGDEHGQNDTAEPDPTDTGDATFGETAALLAEALNALYAHDAIDRGLLHLGGHEPGYTQNRGKGGRWGAGNGPAESSGGGGKGEAKDEGGKLSRSGGGGGGSGSGGKGKGAAKLRGTDEVVKSYEDARRAGKSIGEANKAARATDRKANPEAYAKAGRAKAEGEHKAVDEARAAKSGKSSEEKATARASAKAERESRMADFHASQDREMGLKAGTAAELAKRGFLVGVETYNGQREISIMRESGNFRGENIVTDNMAPRTRMVRSAGEVEHFAALLAAHPTEIAPRTSKAMDALERERSARGNDHIMESWAHASSVHDELAGMTTEGFRAAHDELAARAKGGKRSTAKEESYQRFKTAMEEALHSNNPITKTQELTGKTENRAHFNRYLREQGRDSSGRTAEDRADLEASRTASAVRQEGYKAEAKADEAYQRFKTERDALFAKTVGAKNTIQAMAAIDRHADSHPREYSRYVREQSAAILGTKAPAEPKATEATTRGGKAAKSTTDDGETIHERSARLQREGNLPREVSSSENPKAIRTDLPWRGIDPFRTPDPHFLVTVYGEHQLGSALSKYTPIIYRRIAAEQGVQPARTKAETISRITAKVTNGRYSANFGDSQ